MKTKKQIEAEVEVSDTDLEEISEQIRAGMRSGRLDGEEKHVYWDITIHAWKD